MFRHRFLPTQDNRSKIAFISLSAFLHGAEGLQQHAEDDEGDAQIEREVDLAALAEDEEGQDDGVAGLQVVGQVDGEGRQALQGLNLHQVHAHGAEQGVAEHEPHVGTLGHNHHGLLTGEEPQVDGDDGGDSQQAARHLRHEHIAAAHAHRGPFVEDDVEGTHQRRHDANHDAVAIAGIEREDAEHASDRDERQQQLGPGELALQNERFADGGEEAYE